MDVAINALIKTCEMLFRILPIMFLCLYGTELLSQLGVLKKLEPMGKPLARIARLPPISAITFITGIGSLIAANTMLAAYRGKEKRRLFVIKERSLHEQTHKLQVRAYKTCASFWDKTRGA